MAEPARAAEPTQPAGADSEPTPDDPGRGELVLALAVCALALLGPLIYIQYRYELFTSEHGVAKEGAAGAGLALAVVFRTVSRTVLRTIVRTSARAGMRASLKGALQSAMRVATRNLLASLFRSATERLGTQKAPPGDPAAIGRANLKSLLFASGLLYASWVIVIGLGQPFGALMTAEQAAVVEAEEAAEQRELASRPRPEHEAWRVQEQVKENRARIKEHQIAYKGARDVDERRRLEALLVVEGVELDELQSELQTKLQLSGNKMSPPKAPEPDPEPTLFDDAVGFLFTRAPYPGQTSWASPIIWLGAAVLVLPLWFIYLVQAAVARRRKVNLHHETGVDGGLIQLYFAGAFSFMPLTSDVVVDGDAEDRGRVAMAGLLAPTLLAMILWGAWKATGITPLLFVADAFLIYPMVQTFPLDPLDGVRLWRWSRPRWVLVFSLVMAVFMFAGSEGLKSVI